MGNGRDGKRRETRDQRSETFSPNPTTDCTDGTDGENYRERHRLNFRTFTARPRFSKFPSTRVYPCNPWFSFVFSGLALAGVSRLGVLGPWSLVSSPWSLVFGLLLAHPFFRAIHSRTFSSSTS